VSDEQYLRIVEVGVGIGGSACGRLFCGLGHEVIKVEPSGGDPLRHRVPLNSEGESYGFISLNGGKQSVVADFQTQDGDCTIAELLGGADLAILGLTPADAAAARLDAQTLRERWPELVVISITGFGQTGEFADTPEDSLLAESFGGLATMVGEPGRRPLSLGGEQIAYAAAFTGFLGATLALRRRDHGFSGDFIDVAMCDVAAYMDWKGDVNFAMSGASPSRRRDDGWRLLRAADGWIGMIFQNQHWARMVELVEAEQLRDPALTDEDTRLARADEWWPVVAEWASSRSARAIYDQGRVLGLPLGWVVYVSDLAESEQLRERGFIDPAGFTETQPALGSPFHSDALSWRRGRAPLLAAEYSANGDGDGDGDAVEAKRPTAAEPAPAEGASDAPLAGLTVLDFGTITAGAAATRLLADFGAKIIKIEWTDRPDTFRTWKLTASSADESGAMPMSPFFPSNNVGKLDVAIDLKTDRGRDLVHALARCCDVLVENFRVGVAAKLGVDRETIRALNPSLIYLSLSSQGQFGPESRNSSYGSTLDLLAGLASVTGYDAEQPMWSSSDVNYPDQIVSMFGAAAVAYCLHAGLRGSYLDISQREVVSFTLGGEVAAFMADGLMSLPQGNRRAGRAPHDTYPCLEADSWVAISCEDEATWAGLAAFVQHPEVAGESLSWWEQNQDLVDEWIAVRTREMSRDEVVAALRSLEVPAVPVLNAADRANRRRFVERGVTIAGSNPPVKGLPMVFHEYRAQPAARPAPEIGTDTRAVLSQVLGLSESEIAELEAADVVRCL
jgi:crotonobetainyl-CoA:carnitine CoA-transferase CaiB-like acyl-CoA transferase